VDGTIMEANAGKYTHVWKKNVARYKKAVEERALQILKEADRINQEEDALYGESDLPERGEGSSLSSSEIRQRARALIESGEKEDQKAAKQLEKEAEKLAHYEEQEEILEDRNSYSKTDTDATFMRTKEDMLRPAYNVQAGTQDGFVTGMTISQNGNDARGFIEHMETRKEIGLAPPPTVTADAVYGTEENYEYIEKERIEGYLKYPSWYREMKGKLKPYEKSSFTYDAEQDRFCCPRGHFLEFIKEQQEKTKSGYTRTERIYECRDCGSCDVKSQCTRSQGNRQITHSAILYQHQQKARMRLSSPKGESLRKRRSPEIETVFGHIKHNMSIRRFLLRGLKKVTTEMFWIVLGYNMTHLWSRIGGEQHPAVV
jgi:hypothetical protein